VFDILKQLYYTLLYAREYSEIRVNNFVERKVNYLRTTLLYTEHRDLANNEVVYIFWNNHRLFPGPLIIIALMLRSEV